MVRAIKNEPALENLPIVIVTAASGSGADVAEVKQLGVALVMLKPVTGGAMKKVADRLLR